MQSRPSDTTDSPAKPLRVLLWAPRGSSEQYHGPGSFAFRLYSSRPPDQLQVALAHGNPQQPTTQVYCEQHLIAPYWGGTLNSLRFLYAGKRWLRQNVRRFDVFHGLGGYHYTMAPAYSAHQAGLPAVIFVALQGDEFTDKLGVKRLLGLPRRRRSMLRQIDAVIAMSRAIYAELREYGVSAERIARIPMGVDAARFAPCGSSAEKRELRSRLGWPNRPTLLFAGALVERKRPHLLIEALAQLIRAGQECQVVLAGPAKDRAYQDRMKALTTDLGLEEFVTWTGHSPSIERLYAASDLFALPSTLEGMPAALVEAMSAGLACIGTPVSGVKDLIQDGINGRIVAPLAAELATTILDYLRDEQQMRQHGTAAREVVLRSYRSDIVLQAYRTLFERVVAGQAPCDASTLPEFDH